MATSCPVLSASHAAVEGVPQGFPRLGPGNAGEVIRRADHYALIARHWRYPHVKRGILHAEISLVPGAVELFEQPHVRHAVEGRASG